VRLILPGGIVRPVENSLVGEIARRNLELFFVDRLFLGAGAIDVTNGITEYSVDDAMIKQALISNAKEVVLVADSSKFLKTTFAFVAHLNQISHLISKSLKANHVTVHIAKESSL
jgi:DeoR/GlpR family transcriptional regulator of sugar metabolism